MISGWVKEIKSKGAKEKLGMILIHNGIVRKTAKNGKIVKGMLLTYDDKLLLDIIKKYKVSDGIVDIKVWINQGKLDIGDDIMYVLVAGRFRTDVFPVFEKLVGEIKNRVVKEQEVL